MDYIERIGRVEELIELIADSLETKLNYAHLNDSKFPGISVKESDILYNDVRFKVCEYHGATNLIFVDHTRAGLLLNAHI